MIKIIKQTALMIILFYSMNACAGGMHGDFGASVLMLPFFLAFFIVPVITIIYFCLKWRHDKSNETQYINLFVILFFGYACSFAIWGYLVSLNGVLVPIPTRMTIAAFAFMSPVIASIISIRMLKYRLKKIDFLDKFRKLQNKYNTSICMIFNILAVVVWAWFYSLPNPATEPSKLLLLFILILYLVNFILMFIKTPDFLLKLLQVLNGLLVLCISVLIVIFVFILSGPAYILLLVCSVPLVASITSIQHYRSRFTIKT